MATDYLSNRMWIRKGTQRSCTDGLHNDSLGVSGSLRADSRGCVTFVGYTYCAQTSCQLGVGQLAITQIVANRVHPMLPLLGEAFVLLSWPSLSKDGAALGSPQSCDKWRLSLLVSLKAKSKRVPSKKCKPMCLRKPFFLPANYSNVTRRFAITDEGLFHREPCLTFELDCNHLPTKCVFYTYHVPNYIHCTCCQYPR